MSNPYETEARARKVAKLVDSATFCNDMAVRDTTGWPQDHAEGLRKLAGLLAQGEMWTAVEVFANVNQASAETRGMVVLALLANAEEMNEATDDAIGRELLASM